MKTFENDIKDTIKKSFKKQVMKKKYDLQKMNYNSNFWAVVMVTIGLIAIGLVITVEMTK